MKLADLGVGRGGVREQGWDADCAEMRHILGDCAVPVRGGHGTLRLGSTTLYFCFISSPISDPRGQGDRLLLHDWVITYIPEEGVSRRFL